MGEDHEQQIGDQLAAQINPQLPLITDPALTGYLDRVGGQLAQASARPDVTYRFHIINVDEVNAFAIPGGHIYLNRGLIEKTENASELSGVLAHEIGHIAARHGAEMLERKLRTGTLMGALYRLFLGQAPEVIERNPVAVGGLLWSAAHSRADELEADQLAVRTMIRAGVDPHGIVSLLSALVRAEEERGGASEWFSTHPLSGDRVVRTRAEIDAFRGDHAPDLVRNTDGYTRFRERLGALPDPTGSLGPAGP